MRKIIVSMFFSLVVSGMNAQDVIVKKDGGTILSKVVEVGTEKVKYKKWSNQQGPNYEIKISDITSINYQNGEKEDFSAKSPTQSVKQNELDAESKSINEQAIRNFNSQTITFKKKVSEKSEAGGAICLLGIKEEESVMSNKDLTIMIDTYSGSDFDSKSGKWFSKHFYAWETVTFILKNNSDKPLYIDLAKTFLVRDTEAISYYKASSTTTGTGESSGTSVNLGAIAGVAGVGGVLGTLAGGINVGGGSSSSTSTTVYQERILIIPPYSQKALPSYWILPMNSQIYPELKYKSNPNMNWTAMLAIRHKFDNLKEGQSQCFDYNNSIMRLSFMVTYSSDEYFTDSYMNTVRYYLREAIGVPIKGEETKWNGYCVRLPNNTLDESWKKQPVLLLYNELP